MSVVSKQKSARDLGSDRSSNRVIRIAGSGVEIPLPMNSLDDFRRWATSDEFPEQGRIDYIGGVVEVDMQAEVAYSHGGPKVELARVIGNRVKAADLGEYYCDAMRCSCLPADLSAEPDVVVLLHESFETGRIRLIPKASNPDDYVEIDGSPDLVVEIVSDDSVTKDTKRLFDAYFAAGVREYWIVDARGSEVSFRVLTRGDQSFGDCQADSEGYKWSNILRRSYRLDRRAGRRGQPEYDLRERE